MVKSYSERSNHDKMSKGQFLNLVNNMEVLVGRLVHNHIHAKVSTVYDTDLKRAICDGITNPGEIKEREELAQSYKEIIDYRNLLLQDYEMEDSREVGLGDDIQKVVNQMFQKYLVGELLTNISISNLVLSNTNLEKTSMSNSALQNIKFTGKTKLRNTDFRNSTISNIDFGKEESDCQGINFSDCKLIMLKIDKQVNFSRSIFKNADLTGMGEIGTSDKQGEQLMFEHANFSGANLTSQNIYNACFKYASFYNARLMDCKIGKDAIKEKNTSFEYASLEKAELLRSNIIRSVFDNANLKEATFTSTKIEDTSFVGARLYDANFTRSKIKNCNFEKTYCTNMTMKSANLTNLHFHYAILADVDMSGASVIKVEFNDAVCSNTLWVNTQIEDSVFERSVLTNSRIVGEAKRRTRIKNCNFKYADLSNLAVANVEFENCNFYGADFCSSRLIDVRFINCENLEEINAKNMWTANVYIIDEKGEHLFKRKYCRYQLNSETKLEDDK